MPLQTTMQALADPVRRQILEMLKTSSKTAGEIGDAFSISKPAISRHLSVLMQANLIRQERSGKYLIYSLNASVLEEAMLWLMSFQKPKEEPSKKGESCYEKMDQH